MIDFFCKNVEFRNSCTHHALFLADKTQYQTKDKLDKYHGNSLPSILMAKRWFSEVLCSHTNTSVDECSGCSTLVATADRMLMEAKSKQHG